jgi:hypothetical protein
VPFRLNRMKTTWLEWVNTRPTGRGKHGRRSPFCGVPRCWPPSRLCKVCAPCAEPELYSRNAKLQLARGCLKRGSRDLVSVRTVSDPRPFFCRPQHTRQSHDFTCLHRLDSFGQRAASPVVPQGPRRPQLRLPAAQQLYCLSLARKPKSTPPRVRVPLTSGSALACCCTPHLALTNPPWRFPPFQLPPSYLFHGNTTMSPQASTLPASGPSRSTARVGNPSKQPTVSSLPARYARGTGINLYSLIPTTPSPSLQSSV